VIFPPAQVVGNLVPDLMCSLVGDRSKRAVQHHCEMIFCDVDRSFDGGCRVYIYFIVPPSSHLPVGREV